MCDYLPHITIIEGNMTASRQAWHAWCWGSSWMFISLSTSIRQRERGKERKRQTDRDGEREKWERDRRDMERERGKERGGRSLNRNGLDGGWTGLFFLKPLSLSSWHTSSQKTTLSNPSHIVAMTGDIYMSLQSHSFSNHYTYVYLYAHDDHLPQTVFILNTFRLGSYIRWFWCLCLIFSSSIWLQFHPK